MRNQISFLIKSESILYVVRIFFCLCFLFSQHSLKPGISRDQPVKHPEDGLCRKEAIPMARDGMSKAKGGVISFVRYQLGHSCKCCVFLKIKIVSTILCL